ncbi:MAG: maltose alpha-D-glucosyltransferase [Verrucomicrobiota bacterium]|nr:maltose alpha-D-glucosyltransferase [Verrucomicrobiota bacterium]
MTKLESNPLWFKDAVIYQLHVKTFFDSNADGTGDFRGVLSKLDYLRDLGVNALWLLPFYPSPLRDDGYDIADYYSVNPSYGTVEDFQEFLSQAHRRGMRVITELVLNHTSDQNAWFQRARRAAPGSVERDFYVWSDAPDKYLDARIIFKDFEHSNWTYDPIAKAYFWHRFYSHQPDLNFENPAVHRALFEVVDFWLEMGVDGVRLDAVPYLYERDGTNCENLPETHEFLRRLRTHVDQKFTDRMLLAEANQWPEDAVAYFGKGDECHMNFHFPLMPRLFMSLQMEDRFPIIDILDQTPAIPDSCQWGMFLRNHDELTLEMVTDEERDYMWRVYATDPRARINLGIRRRLAPLVSNNRRKIELLNMLLFSMPGTPIIYYGDEIGMGDNFYLGDRNGVRTPMQWSPDRNAGFSKANPQQLFLPVIIDPEYNFESVNVENQERNLSSLLWWTRRVLAMRKRFRAFGRGTIEFLSPDNAKVLAFARKFESETVLVVANLSRFAQVTELDLSAYAGRTPTEVFSRNQFPTISAAPYSFMLGPNDYFWLALDESSAETQSVAVYAPPTLETESQSDEELAAMLPAYLMSCRWFGGKARPTRGARIAEKISIGTEWDSASLYFVEINYADGSPETYLLPLKTALDSSLIEREFPNAIVARVGVTALHDAVYDPTFRDALFDLVNEKRKLKTDGGRLSGVASTPMEKLPSRVLKVEQSNTSIVYGDKYFLKLYRKLEDGVNPDAEILRFLSGRFANVPQFHGAIEYRRDGGEPRVLGLLLGLVPNEGDAWSYTLDAVGRFLERTLGVRKAPFSNLEELVGGVYPERARQLGARTAEMHIALSSDSIDPNFSPEPFSGLYQRSLYQSIRGSVRRTLAQLRRNLGTLPEGDRARAEKIVASETEILQGPGALLTQKLTATRTRTHGDYHLGQVLNTGKDFVIIDFEGEPSRALTERKLKRSPLRDVAGMVRSFHYAAHSALGQFPGHDEERQFLAKWADDWADFIARIFLDAYLATAAGASFIPREPGAVDVLLDAFILEKALYEIAYELNNRPDWISIPLRGVGAILDKAHTS